ncbi:sensor domain-containing diguanylate cyclase [Pseudoduganella lutea]|uniref:Diguanylate cyclase n=1 Tax=Pseudoduganella lutea TaxID=321985 RepID=A0A4V0Z3E6_9BURK|nr:diguanylate cyclase [Pseudoduganella lutea]QBE63173.1 diguanylate cyclase [Pseudoduganella lutea]
MGSLFHQIRKALAARALPAGVFAAGLVLSGYAGVASVEHAGRARLVEQQDAVEDYLYLLRHRLDLYVGASRDLAALFSASNAIEAEEFSGFVDASGALDRLDGLRAFGYVPRVPAGEAAGFEAQAQRRFPGYRIVERRSGAQDFYPLLYGRHAFDTTRMDALRGLDFSSFPKRWTAMQEAARLGEPVATGRMPAMFDPRPEPVIQLLTPVRMPGSGAPATRQPELKGYVFTTLYLQSLFIGFDNGRMARQFDLVAYDGAATPGHILFDANDIFAATSALRRGPFVQQAKVRFANRTWLIHFHARPGPADALPLRAGAQAVSIGIVLSLLAAWAIAAWPRYRARRRAMHDFSERFASFFEQHPFAVYAIDRQRRFRHANHQMLKELGVERHALLGTRADTYVGIEDRVEVGRHLDEALAGQVVAYTTRIADAAGRMVDMSIVLIPMSTGDDVTHVLGFAENITGRKEAERALYASRQMLQLILDNIPQSVFWKNAASVYEGGNRALLADAGLDSEAELIGKTDFDLHWRDQAPHYHQVDAEVMRSGLARMRMQALDRSIDGTERWFETSKIPLKDGAGNVTGVLAVTEDITARKYMEQELFRRAHHDALTGLPNRGFFNGHLEQAVARAQRHGALALMYFDIDRFKAINDTHGHDVGDDVIRMFAGRVRAVVREADFVARLGGDEFVLVAEGLQEAQAATLIAHKIIAAMAPPFQLGTVTLPVTTSIGIASFESGMTSRTLIRAADQAMYDAKRSGRNCFRLAPPAQDRSAA